MSRRRKITPTLRIVYFGTANELSRAALQVLLTSGVRPQAIVVPAQSAVTQARRPLERLRPPPLVSQLPLVGHFHQPTIVHAAWEMDVPVFAFDPTARDKLRDMLRDLELDIACVVCFPHRLPAAILSLPALGFLNVHPSLLPHYRGPAPLFWLFRQNDLANRGISVHQMDEGLDTGPLVRQEPVAFPDGMSQVMVEHQCGEAGGRLLLEAIEELSRGQLAKPQAGDGSYYPWPTAADCRLRASWSALRAFNFMRATDGSRATYPVALGGTEVALAEALQVQPELKQDSAVLHDGAVAHIQFTPGVLTATVASAKA